MIRALALSSHPGPSAVVTTIAAVLGIAVGLDPGRLALLATAVLAGQLSIGWANDALDADRDRLTGRADKPVAAGRISRRAVAIAAGAAAVVSLLLALPLGPLAWGAHVLSVAGGWAYDLGLKATAASAVPFAVSFGLLPVIAASALPAEAASVGSVTLPAWWAIACAALLGVAAHLANALRDLADDAATGIRGLPHRLGRTTSLVAAAGLMLAAALLVLLAPAGAPDWPGLVAVGIAAPLAVALLAGLRSSSSGRGAFQLVMAMSLGTVVALAGLGSRLLA